MRNTAAVVLKLTTVFCLFGCYPAFAQQTNADLAKTSLSDLRLMVGQWQGEVEGSFAEEFWSAPQGDSMMCIYRSVKDGKTEMYELVVIEATAQGPVMRLKHFNPGLIGWEEKAQVYSYPLISLKRDEAVFENSDKKTRLTYRRTAPDSLAVILEHMVEAKMKPTEFKFKLGSER